MGVWRGNERSTRNGFAAGAAWSTAVIYSIEGRYGDMKITLNVDPSKTAGQGFGSATGQYMDICIKFDTRTLTGYALRIIRTTKYSNAVDFMLMKYEEGRTTAISFRYLPPVTVPTAPLYLRLKEIS